jgi:hypothetical protein
MRAIFYVCSVWHTFKDRASASQTGSVRGGDSFCIVTFSRRAKRAIGDRGSGSDYGVEECSELSDDALEFPVR